MNAPRPWADLSPDERTAMIETAREAIAAVPQTGAVDESMLAGILADVEQRASHPAYRGQRRRVLGFEMVDINPGGERPSFRSRCLAEGCGELFAVGDPAIAAHHQTHREGH